MYKLRELIKESPDMLYIITKHNDTNHNFKLKILDSLLRDIYLVVNVDLLALAFMYLIKILMCTTGLPLNTKLHYNLYKYVYDYLPLEYRKKYNLIEYHDILDYLLNYQKIFTYPGRIFKDSKILTFWQFPENSNKLNSIINDFKLYNINIDNTWLISVKIPNRDIIRKLSFLNPNWYKVYSSPNINNNVFDLLLLPINLYYKVLKYINRSNWNESTLFINHILSPMLKKSIIVYQKFKKLPKNMTQALYNAKKTRYTFTENKKI